MKRILLSLVLLLAPTFALAQSSIDARQVQVRGIGRLDQVLAAKVDAAALAAKADAATTTSALALKAPLGSPALTGTPTAPTPSATATGTALATVDFAEPKITRNYNVRSADGVSGTNGLNAAIAQGSTSTITLPAGNFTLSAGVPTQTITGSNVVIQGRGNATKINVPCGHDGRVFTSSGATQLIIRDLQIVYASGCAAGQTPTTQAFKLDDTNDSTIRDITVTGGYGLFLLGQTARNARLTIDNIVGGGWDVTLGGKAIELYRGTSNAFYRVRYTGTGLGTASTRAFYAAPLDLVDTVRLENDVIYSTGGVPTLVELNFSGGFGLPNVFFRNNIFDSSISQAVLVTATGTLAANMSLLYFEGNRFATDAGAGIKISLLNPNVFIKTIEITNNYIVSKSATGYQINFDAASTGLVRAAKVRANTFGDAVPTGSTQSAAVLLGMDNVGVFDNVLSAVDETTVNGTMRTSYLAKATRANLRNLLIGNFATLPITGTLDESAFTLGLGRVVASNFP